MPLLYEGGWDHGPSDADSHALPGAGGPDRGARLRRRQHAADTHASRAREYSIHWARTAVLVQAMAKPFMVRLEPSG